MQTPSRGNPKIHLVTTESWTWIKILPLTWALPGGRPLLLLGRTEASQVLRLGWVFSADIFLSKIPLWLSWLSLPHCAWRKGGTLQGSQSPHLITATSCNDSSQMPLENPGPLSSAASTKSQLPDSQKHSDCPSDF